MLKLSRLGLNNKAIDVLQATNEEVEYLQRLLLLQSKQRDSQTTEQNYLVPTMIIDGFLYHGAIEHAHDMKLLEELDIKHIINVSHIQLGQHIVDEYNVLWINLNDSFRANIHHHFDQTNEFLQTCRNKNEKVLAHCQSGISRSTSVILAYLLK